MDVEAIVHEPVEGLTSVEDSESHQIRISRALAEPHDIVEMGLGRILDTLRLLQLRTGGAHLRRGQMQRAAEDTGRLDD